VFWDALDTAGAARVTVRR